jgi:hypothetical protein
MKFGGIAVSSSRDRVSMTCNENTKIDARCMYNDTHAFWSGLIPDTCDVSGKSSDARKFIYCRFYHEIISALSSDFLLLYIR